MLHPDELEEMEYQIHADADYLSEAFGDEARLLAREDRYEYEPRVLSTEDQLALDLWVARRHLEHYTSIAYDPKIPF